MLRVFFSSMKSIQLLKNGKMRRRIWSGELLLSWEVAWMVRNILWRFATSVPVLCNFWCADLSKSSSRVIVIGATNDLDAIDSSLRRGGRFDREVPLGIPNETARLRYEYFKHHENLSSACIVNVVLLSNVMVLWPLPSQWPRAVSVVSSKNDIILSIPLLKHTRVRLENHRLLLSQHIESPY